MDVRLTEEQRMLALSAREFLESECPMSLVRESMDDPAVAVARLWPEMSKIGWTGLAVPEAHGGAGLGWIELAVLMEEMGRALQPAPFFSSAVLATGAICILGRPEQRERWLPDLAEGTVRGALAYLEPPATWQPDQLTLEARSRDDGVTLHGVKSFVADVAMADFLIVPARGPHGIAVHRVEMSDPGIAWRRVQFSDETRPMYEVTFDAAFVPTESRLDACDPAVTGLERLLDGARAVLAAEMVGAAERVLESSVQFARTREQFGRPIGSFQAIQHKCADMLVQIESARSAAYYAAWAVSEGEPYAHTAALLAKAHCADVFLAVAGEGIQIHGGLGFTWEQDLHLYFKRAKADEMALGDPAWCREQVARLVIDEGAPAP